MRIADWNGSLRRAPFPRLQFNPQSAIRNRQSIWLALLALGLGALAGCNGGDRNFAADEPPAVMAERAPEGGGAEAAAPNAAAGTVLFVGTSLTAGLGLPPEQAYPALVQQKIDAAGLPFRVVNAGVSGETSAGALRRLGWVLRQPAEVIVLETGANDMLRGHSPDSIRANLQAIIERVRAAQPQARLVLVGMRAAPNLGARYGRAFERIYPTLAEENELPLVPFLLEGVGGVDSLNQADGVHPNARGQQRLAQNVWAVLEPVLRQAARERGGAQ